MTPTLQFHGRSMAVPWHCHVPWQWHCIIIALFKHTPHPNPGGMVFLLSVAVSRGDDGDGVLTAEESDAGGEPGSPPPGTTRGTLMGFFSPTGTKRTGSPANTTNGKGAKGKGAKGGTHSTKRKGRNGKGAKRKGRKGGANSTKGKCTGPATKRHKRHKSHCPLGMTNDLSMMFLVTRSSGSSLATLAGPSSPT